MFPGHVTPGIAVVHVPDIASDLLLQNHDVTRSNRRHAGRRGSARETAPIAGEIQLGNDPSKAEQRRLAATEGVRASRGPTADCPFVALMITDEGRLGEKSLIAIMVGMGFGLNRGKQQQRYKNS